MLGESFSLFCVYCFILTVALCVTSEGVFLYLCILYEAKMRTFCDVIRERYGKQPEYYDSLE